MSRPVRILILDDAPEDAELAERELRRAGLDFEARKVDSREGFVDALASFAPDLILSDYSLPGMDGATALVLSRAALPDVPLVFVSGTIGEEQAIQSLRAGATDYVLKNRLARLAPAVRRALGEAAERSERRRAEAELRRSEDLHRTVVSALAEGVLLLADDGRIVSCNDSAARILGGDADALVGRRLDEVGCRFLREDESPLDPALFPVSVTLRTGTPQATLVGLQPASAAAEPPGAPAGRTLWVMVSSRLLFEDRRDREAAVVCSLYDVTERRALEVQLLQSQKLESLGQLAGGVAHDFNNLMTVVMGCCELAVARLASDPGATSAYIREAYQAGERAAALTRQLLAFSRKQVLNPRVIELGDLVGNLLPMLGRLIRENIEVRFVRAKEPSKVNADPGQLEQVLVNLVVNAIDAMPRGGRLRIATGNLELAAGDALPVDVPPGPYAALTVGDSGAGMDRETQARIFEPFFTTKEKGRGTGLGLSTVYGIVKQSGGTIRVQSELGRGTLFEVLLPRVELPVAHAADAPRAKPAAAGTATLLLVEDEASLRPLIREMLEGCGYRVLDADRGSTALEICARHEGAIDLLVTDMVLPEMDGAELAERIQELRPGIGVLFLSGYSDLAVEGMGPLGPGRAFLPKPFTIGALAAKVGELVAGGVSR